MLLKQKDLGTFTIPCVIGNASFKRVLYDLGASISVMPKHVYDSLSLEPLNKTSIVIQLADRSFVYPLGVIEDVIVKIDSLVIPCNFYILDMEHDSCPSYKSYDHIVTSRRVSSSYRLHVHTFFVHALE